MKEKKCFIMGLPEAGKTTYLAALWYVLKNSRNNKLTVKKYTGDLSYLTKISAKWVNTEEIERTKPTYEQKSIVLTLENDKKDIISLSFPDLSGESFQLQYEKRETEKELAKFVKESEGILLFINPENIKEPFLISEIPKSAWANGEDENMECATRNPKETDPTQVILVELLQFVMYMRNENLINVGIIISAWDLVRNYKTPEDFIKNRLPLLWQYIFSNSKYLKVSLYGISAQGGSFDNRDELLKNENPCERIIVVDNTGKISNDITLPLSMVVNGESENNE